MITSGLLLSATQLSFGGSRLRTPTQAVTLNGFTLRNVLACVCVTNAVVVYGNEIKSPVLVTPVDEPDI